MIQSIVPASGEYALRAAVCLAQVPPDGWMTAKELAEVANIPPAYLSKVLRRLVQNGMLVAQRGHHGGFRLARPPFAIRVIDLLVAAEIDVETKHCAFGFAACNDALPCPLHDLYKQLDSCFRAWATGHTLAEVDLSRIPQRRSAG